ncbi:hypothetical protein ACE41H_17780 [Paenibacillus enshidis]|uniref:DUF5301 domain-containing protein n=1 Tax=Paenibacillus enshidis TaxID=1458439 RepID=A0ABV5AX94_9BACL
MKSTAIRKYIYIVIGIAIVITAYFIMRPYTTSFKELVLDRVNINSISSIEIVKAEKSSDEEKKIVVTDRKEIENIMHGFAEVKLKESDFDNSGDSYWFYIKVDGYSRFGLQLNEQNQIHVFDRQRDDKYRSASYQITNDFNKDFIGNLFN